ncbi:MAG: domain S-box-containing protein [Bacteroidetes bacterium]|nr:domain S-box-containing protein [Bacteroidota bacterium]
MKDDLQFNYLPAYAGFLLENKVKEFTAEQLRLLRELNLPLLRYYEGFSDEQLIEQGIDRSRGFLRCFKDNKVEQFIENAITEWLANQIPLISREKLLPEDITLISYMRRKIFRNFLPEYTNDATLSLQILEEVDAFTVKLETLSFKHLLELQHQLYEQAEALAHIGNWTWDLNTKYLVWSEEMFRIYELEHTENANDHNIRAFTHPEDIALVDTEMEHTIKTLQPHDFYYRIILESGREKYVHAKGQPEMNKDGVAIRMFGTLQDVTSQKKFENELKKSEERYHGMINEVQDYAIILLDKDGNILNWNKGAEKIKGYKAEEAIGKNFKIFYTEKDRQDHLSDKLLKLAREEGRATHEGWRQRKDGTVFWGSVVITCLHNESGQIIGFSKVTRDLTERKLAEDKLIRYAESIERKNKMLEQANKELESFSYVASHDLQEPLRKIQAFTSRLLQKENDNLSEWGKDVFGKVQLSANRMQKLIEALLNFSRLDKAQEAYEPVDAALMLEEIKNNLQEMIEPNKAVILADPLPVMNVIPVQFHQLLSNLISNALKYSKPDVAPVIKISYGLKEGRAIPGNSLLDLNKYHHICISDNGIGFEQQYAEKIFELFQRLHGKSEYEGTGIGLAICKKIVANHHGFINAVGKPGEGAEFNVYIPSERKTELA